MKKRCLVSTSNVWKSTLGDFQKILYPSCWSFCTSSVLWTPSQSPAMQRYPRLEDAQKSGAIRVHYFLSIALSIFIVLVIFPGKLVAQAPIPELKVVQPHFDTILGMRLEWTWIKGVQAYEIQRKVDDGSYGEWKNVFSNTVYIDNDGITEGHRYTYKLRAKMHDGSLTPVSLPRSNILIKIWPVAKNLSCTAAESIGLLHSHYQSLQAWEVTARKYLHHGIDIRGVEELGGECVRAPMGGIISSKTHHADPLKGSNDSVLMHVYLNGKRHHLSFGHLTNVNTRLRDGESVEPGTPLGNITVSHFNRPAENHVHISFDDGDPLAQLLGDVFRKRNPLEMWDSELYRDPWNHPPHVEITNSASLASPLKFRRGPDKATYLSGDDTEDDKVYGAIDIVVEARDHQSFDTPWQSPLKIGYYIQKVESGGLIDVVRSSVKPYLLINGENEFGVNLYDVTDPAKVKRMNTLLDLDDSLQADFPTDKVGWPYWYTYIVTNTTGTEGTPETLDANQCWATDAHKNEQSPNRLNGYRDDYESAKTNKDALFPDGIYQIGIRLEDYVHTYAKGNVTDHMEPVVDNFALYVEKVIVTTAEGDSVYEAGWEISGDRTT